MAVSDGPSARRLYFSTGLHDMLRSSSRALWLLSALLLGSSIPTATCVATANAADGEIASTIVARWRDGLVDQATFESWLRDQRIESVLPHERLGHLEEMVTRIVLSDAAAARGADAKPEIRFAMSQFETRQLVRAVRRDRQARVEVDAEAIERQVRAQPELRHKPRKLRLRNIFKRVSSGAGSDAWAAAREQMIAIRKQLVEGADFAALARQESDSQTRFQGGLIGNVDPETLPPDIAETAAGLAAGALSPVFETPDGLILLRCDRVFDAVKRSPDEVRTIVTEHLHRLREREDWTAFQDDMLTAAKPELDLRTASDPKAPADAVVARSTHGRLTNADLVYLSQSRPGRLPPHQMGEDSLRGVLHGWAVQTAIAHHARALGLDDDPEVQSAVTWHRRKLLAEEELAYRIRAVFVPLEEAEIRAYFEAHRDDFKTIRRFDVSVIAIGLPEAGERDRYHFAEMLHRDLVSGRLDFESAAREHSEHASAVRGGHLLDLTPRELAGLGPQPARVVMGLQPGSIGSLVQQDETVYIVRLDARREATLEPWEKAAKDAENALGNERIASIQAKIERKVRSELAVRLVESAAP